MCAADGAGNTGSWSGPYKLDTTSPSASATGASSGWYYASPSITLSASDSGGSGLSYSKYIWDSSTGCVGSGMAYSNGGTITMSAGSHTLYLCVADNAGNTGTWSGGYNLDNIAPTVTALSPSAAATKVAPILNYTVTDTGGSNLSSVQLWRTTDSSGAPNSSGWAQVSSASISGSSYSGSFTDSSAAANTIYWYGIHALDAAGSCINESGGHCGGVSSDSLDTRAAVGPDKVAYDTTAPVCGSWSPSSGPWHNTATGTSFTLSGSTDSGGSGINVSGGPCTTGTTNGSTCSITISDNAGNTFSCTSPTNNIDTTAPTVSANNSSAGWYSSSPTITLSSSDSGGSGLSYSKYIWNNSTGCSSSGTSYSNGATIAIPSQGANTLYLCGLDNAGNTGTWSGAYNLDTTAPSSLSLSPSSSITNNTNITVSFSATDSGGSGLSGYKYCYTTNGTTCSPVTSGPSVTFSSVGSYTVCFNAADNAGNTSATTCSAANAYQYTSVSAPSGTSASASVIPGLQTISANWSGTATGFKVYYNYSYGSTVSSITNATPPSGNISTFGGICPADYTVYIVAYNTDNSLAGGTSAGCSGTWGNIPNAQCTVTTKQVQLRTCTSGFFGQ